MSRDLQDFAKYFAVGYDMADRSQDRAWRRNRQDKIDNFSGADWTNPELIEFDRRYGRGTGTPRSYTAPSSPRVQSFKRGGRVNGNYFDREGDGKSGAEVGEVAGGVIGQVVGSIYGGQWGGAVGKKAGKQAGSGVGHLIDGETDEGVNKLVVEPSQQAMQGPDMSMMGGMGGGMPGMGGQKQPQQAPPPPPRATIDTTPVPEDEPNTGMRRTSVPVDGGGMLYADGGMVEDQVPLPDDAALYDDPVNAWAREGAAVRNERQRVRRASDNIVAREPREVRPADFERTSYMYGDPPPRDAPAAKPANGAVSATGRATRPEASDRPMTVPAGQLPDYEASDVMEGKPGVPRFSATAGEGGGDVAGAAPATSGGGARPSATGGAAGSGAGARTSGGRKRLNDQTRTEAFDENLDADDPDNVLKGAIKGGMMYATQMFHLGNPQDPNSQAGTQAFMQGVGAPDPQTAAAVDQSVQAAAPDDYSGPLGRAKLQLRRMEIMYRWAVANGNTERANKMAFEMMQYAAGTASQYGRQAASALKAGDLNAGTQLVARALDEIPDGMSVSVGQDGSIVYTNARGQVVSQERMSPKQLFNIAMGLDNRSMYWNILAERAGLVPSVQRAGAGARATEMHNARMETQRLRQDRLRQTIAKGNARGGGAVASPVADVLADIRSRMPARGGVPTSSQPATPPQGSDDGAAGDDDDDEPVVTQGGDVGAVTGDGQPPRPADAPPVPATAPKPPPRSVLRLKDPPARQGVVPSPTAGKFDPNGDGYDYETARAAGITPGPDGHWASRDPRTGMLLKGRKHPTFQKGVEKDAKLGYTLSQGDDGRFYTQKAGADVALPPKPAEQTEAFDEPHPLAEFRGRDPYADLLAGVNPKTGKRDPAITQYWATKQGRAERSNILAEQRALNNDIKAWEKRKADFDKKQKAANAAGKGGGSKPRDVAQTDDLSRSITAGIATRLQDKSNDEKTGRPKQNTFNDGLSDPKELHDLTMDLVTSNTNMPTERALDWLGELTRQGNQPNEQRLRSFKVEGWTPPPSKYVVLSPERQPNQKIKITEDGYKRLQMLVDARWRATVKKGQEKGWGDVAAAAGLSPNDKARDRAPFVGTIAAGLGR